MGRIMGYKASTVEKNKWKECIKMLVDKMHFSLIRLLLLIQKIKGYNFC